MNSSYRSIVVLAGLLLLVGGIANAQITTTGSGNWSSTTADAPWPGGIVPTATDNVVIASGHTVTIDTTVATCNDLVVSGYLYFPFTTGRAITVNGNVTVNASARFRVASGNPTSGVYYHTIELKKNLTVISGGIFDMRQGSSGIFSAGRLVFTGSTNDTIRLAGTAFVSSSSPEDFNSVVINKSEGAKVVLAAGNLYQNNNTTNGPDTLVLVSGIIETGTNHWVMTRTSSSAIVGASATSYVYGILGRGVTNSAGNQQEVILPVGTATQYRPVSVHIDGPANATGHYVWAKIVDGDANTGTSTLNGGLSKVSQVRYAAIGYVKSTSATKIPVDRISLSYGSDDGVMAGNSDLRVAYSKDARATWTPFTTVDTVHTTNLTAPPTMITPDSLTVADSLNDGATMYAALGTVNSSNNPLAPTGTGVDGAGEIPTVMALDQNYPNPFNPTTNITYGVPASGHVTLAVFNLLGQKVATLVNGTVAAGTHTAIWNGRDESGRVVPTGIYIYRLDGSGVSQAKRMVMMK